MATYTGTLEVPPASFTNGDTLDGVTILGPIEVGAANETLYVDNGLTVETAAGDMPGTINVTGFESALALLDSETLDNVLLNLGDPSSTSQVELIGLANTTTLTLGGNAVMTVAQGAAGFYGGALVNDGEINLSGGDFGDSGLALTNTGIIAISNNSLLDMGSSLVNVDLISISDGSLVSQPGGVLTNTGSLAVAAGGTLALLGATLDLLGGTAAIAGTVLGGTIDLSGGTLSVSSGATLDGVTLVGPFDISASFETLNFKGGFAVETAAGGIPGTISLTGAGVTLSVLDSETLDNLAILLNGGDDGISETSGGTLTLASTVTITVPSFFNVLQGGSFVSDGQITINGVAAQIYDTAAGFTNNGIISITDGGDFDANGGFTNVGTIAIGTLSEFDAGKNSSFDNTGSIIIASNSGLLLDGNVTLRQLGQISAGAGGVVSVNGGGTLDLGGGTLDVAAGSGFADFEIQGVVDDGTIVVAGGSLTVGAGATLDPGVPHPRIIFNGPNSALVVEAASFNTGTLAGITAGDTIVLWQQTVTGVTSSGNSLTIDTSAGPFVTALAAPLTGLTESFSGGAVTFAVAACYLHGTHIATPTGERPIETLSIGDHVATASGIAKPIRWIGRRSYPRRFVARSPELVPVCIRAGALADNVPSRDLFVSPLHAMFIDGVLVPAVKLVNGATIVQPEASDAVEYYHIELDHHDILLAESAPSESFEDDDSRMIFHNAHDFFALYPDAPRRPARYCASRITGGSKLEAIRERISIRAGRRRRHPAMPLHGAIETITPKRIAGWAQNPLHPQAPVCLDIVVDGEIIAQTLARAAFSVQPQTPLTPRQLDQLEVRRSLDHAKLPRAA